jgi:chromosome segregation ATPase
MHHQAVEMVQVQLDEARKQVEILEQQFHSKQEAVTKVAKELEAAEAKISTLKRDVLRTSEAMSLGEKSMHLARNQAAEARKTLYNPLHHPKVKSLLGK